MCTRICRAATASGGHRGCPLWGYTSPVPAPAPVVTLYGHQYQGKLDEWENVIQRMNSYLIAYGRQNNIQLGTTLAGLLLFRDKYYTVNVGDSRIYEVAELGMQCLTKDQSLVMWEVEQGRLSPEELEHDPRRNILLQCIGASGTVQPDYSSGKLEYDAVYMLCCDGFRHEIQPKEFYELLRPSAQKDGKMLKGELPH